MRIIRVSETFYGGPMVELDAEPMDDSGTLHVSDELAEALRPYLADRDNIAVRFSANGLPTTATAVVTEIYTPVAGSADFVRWYSMRAIIFETETGKTGANVYFKPIRTEMLKHSVQQEVPNGRVYNFREVYDSMEESSDDMERLVGLAEAHFSRSQAADKPSIPLRQEKGWFGQLFKRGG